MGYVGEQSKGAICAVDSLAFCMINLTWSSLLLTLALVVTGIFLKSNSSLNDAYGSRVVPHWEGLVTTGVIVAFPGIFLSNYAVKRHNKFWLLVYGFLLFVVLLYHSYFALLLSGLSKPNFSFQDIYECVSYVAVDRPHNISDKCVDYYRDENTMGVYNMWVKRFIQSKEQDTDMLTWGVSMQKAGRCCGFGRPGACWRDRTMPTDLFPDYILPTLHFMFYTPYAIRAETNDFFIRWSECGEKDQWYPATSGEMACIKDIQDNDDDEFYMGGCEYDLPIAGCDGTPGLDGCSWYLMTTLVGTLEIFWTAMVVYILFDLLLLFVTVLYFLKRKDAEVLPIIYIISIPRRCRCPSTR